MRFLHLSDLQIGKRLDELSLVPTATDVLSC